MCFMYVIICACEDGYEYKCLYMNCDQIANQEMEDSLYSVLSVCVRVRVRVCSVLYSCILNIRSSDVIQCGQKGLHHGCVYATTNPWIYLAAASRADFMCSSD